jgi:hypothetical protein
MPLGGAAANWICQGDGSWSSAPDCVPVWDSELGETSAANPSGKTFTLFKLPPRYPAFPDSVAGAQQYANTCAAYGLQTIGCDPISHHSFTGVNMVNPHGMGMPYSSFGCNIKLHDKTGWTSVAFLESNGNMYGVNAGGGYDSSPNDGFAPVCALAH